MKANLLCGKETIRLELPDSNVFIENKPAEGLVNFNSHHSDPDNFVSDQWCAQNIYQALAHAGKIFIYSPGLSEEDVARFQGIKVMDCQATVDDLLKTHKNVAVIPDGPYVVGKIVNQ